MKKKLLKSFVLLFGFLLLIFSCRHDREGKKGKEDDTKQEKMLVLSTFKVGKNTYNKEEKTILVTKGNLKEEDIEEIAFTDESGNVVAGVNWKMNPPRLPQIKADSKFKIEVKTPPEGYKPFESKEITPIRELVPPEITSITVHGVKADLTKTPFTVRIPKPTVETPLPGFPGAPLPEIEVRFKQDVPSTTVNYEGLPSVTPLMPEQTAHVTIRVAESTGKWRAGEYKLDITFDTPSLIVDTLKIKGQDGDVDFSDQVENKKIKLMVKNNKETVTQDDIEEIKFIGDYISQEELNKLTKAIVIYEGLPLNNLQVSVPQTFTIKVDAKDKVYKAFEVEVTVTRANSPLVLKSISVLNQNITDIDNLAITVQTMQTFIGASDIKATFVTPTQGDKELKCYLIGGDKLALKAGVINDIIFKVPPTDAYAEYRNTIRITHSAKWDNMIKIPMPDNGVTWLSGNRDNVEKTLNRKIEIGQFPVTYKLWTEVINWAEGPQGQARGYTNVSELKRIGNNGAIRAQGEVWGAGHTPYDENIVMPVCAMTHHAALVWCNAYSEMKGYAPAYYRNMKDKVEAIWSSTEGKDKDGKDWHIYSTLDLTVKIGDSVTKEEINALALRDALNKHHPDKYGNEWENIRDNYLKVAILTAKQAKWDDGSKNGFRLVDTDEWELAARLRLRGGANATTSTLLYDGKTYFFAKKDCGPGSEGYGADGSEIAKVAWCAINSAVENKLQTHPIGHKCPTDLGFYDLAGNVRSWTNTWSKSNGSDGEGVDDYTYYVVAGGFADPTHRCTVFSFIPSSNWRSDQTGMRLARTLED